MNTKDLEILLGITEILEEHKIFSGDDYRVYNALNKIFNNADYNIEMYYMHLPRVKAAERAIKRFTEDDKGRYVPLTELLKMKDNEENFDKLKHYASKWAFYNNDVPSEADLPILIDKNY